MVYYSITETSIHPGNDERQKLKKIILSLISYYIRLQCNNIKLSLQAIRKQKLEFIFNFLISSLIYSESEALIISRQSIYALGQIHSHQHTHDLLSFNSIFNQRNYSNIFHEDTKVTINFSIMKSYICSKLREFYNFCD